MNADSPRQRPSPGERHAPRDQTTQPPSAALVVREEQINRNWLFTVPNIICLVRLIGSGLVVGLAIADLPYWFVGLFTVLNVSDWIDGRLARWLNQRTDFGARLDSFADAALYAALLVGSALLAREAVSREWPWLALAVGSYLLSTLAGVLKYHRVPSYHTWAAKRTQVLVLVAGIALVLELSVWPLRLAALAVTWTNIEAILLTAILPTWQADVPSLWHVLRRPMEEDPMEEDPMKEDPVKEDPVKEDPVKEAPVKEDPVKEDPVK